MYEIHFEITLKCSHACLHCSSYARNDIYHPPLSTIEDRLDRLGIVFSNKIAEIVLTGGEPISRSDISHIVKKSKVHANRVTMFTTGSTDSIIYGQSEWEKLRDIGLEKTVFSVHSLDPDINDKIFGGPVLNGLLLSIKAAMLAGLKVEINCVLCALNYRSLGKTIEGLINNFNVDKVRLLRLVSQGRAADQKHELWMSNEKSLEIVETMMNQFPEKIHAEGFPKYYDCRSNIQVGKGCQFGRGFLHVDVEGNIYPCPAIKRDPSSLIASLKNINNVRESIEENRNRLIKALVEEDSFGCFSQASWLNYNFKPK